MGDTFTLNQGQRAAAKAFFDFLFTDETEFGISGGGGFGKTHLMRYLIDVVIPEYQAECRRRGIKCKYSTVAMTATTNKAASVLSELTGRPAGTIHSFLNLRVKEDYKTGRSQLTKTPQWTVHTNMVIFLDEGSMVDSALDRVIQEGTHDCKIVYVSDMDQLAPVGEKLSPIYREGRMQTYHLTEPMRNAEQPALMNVCQQLRKTVQTGIFQPIQIVPGVIDLLTDDEMEAEVKKYFAEQTRTSRVLAYTNQAVNEYNEFIRNERGLPYNYQEGEILINNQAIQFGRKQSLSVEEEVEILDISSETEMLLVDARSVGKTEIEVHRATLQSTTSGVIENVPLPVDRNYFNSLLKYYSSQKNWFVFYGLQKQIPDLRPRDAATVHKAQGSTYEVTFIDLTNLSTCRQSDVAARLLYVALSRASNRVVLRGNLAAKYGGLIH